MTAFTDRHELVAPVFTCIKVFASRLKGLFTPGAYTNFVRDSSKEHFGKDIASYPPRAVLFNYIKGRLEKTNFRDKIRFNTNVRDVRFHHDTNQFEVISRNNQQDTENLP